MSQKSELHNTPRTLTQVTLLLNGQKLQLEALIDSGADGCFMDWQFARNNQVGVKKLNQPINASALNGQIISQVTHFTEPCEISFEGQHSEIVTFHLFDSAQHTLILGYPWLHKNNLHVDWETGKILGWRKDELTLCLSENVHRSKKPEPEPTALSKAELAQYPDLAQVPQCYMDLKEVFNKS